ncbi:MAG: ribosome recycling factor [Dehalococcoidia bacterium]|jgi:ribosome recycling factor
MIDETIENAERRMKSAVSVLQRELDGIRSGRARPGLVEGLKVDVYGSAMPLNQLATIAVPEARLITIQPWDRQSLGAIEKAILKSDLGLNPSNDGHTIRLAVPQLTEQRRKELVKIVHNKVEEGRVAVRNVRRHSVDELRSLDKGKEISDDEEKRAAERLQKLTDRYVEEIDKLGREKEAELLEV